MADFETEVGESIAALNSYTHDGEWVWMLNSTSPLASAEFVDRKGSALEPTFNPSTLQHIQIFALFCSMLSL